MHQRGTSLPVIFLLLIVVFWLLYQTASASIGLVPSPLRPIIKQSAERWLPGVDWRLWAAQLYQESRFNCRAVSPVGARGCAQVMPGTWNDITRDLRWQLADPFSADMGIEAGAYYMAKQRAVFRATRPEACRHDLAMAAYNAGAGHVIKAQKLDGGGGRCWPEVASHLPAITGRHAVETITYVQRIRERWYPRIMLEQAP